MPDLLLPGALIQCFVQKLRVYLEYHKNVCKVCGEPLRRISRRRNVRAATHAGLRHGVIVRKRCTDDMCQAVHEFDHVKYVSDDRVRYIILNSAVEISPRNWLCAC